MTDIYDCSADPGRLREDAAILAIGLHHDCLRLCWPQLRAMEAVGKEYGPHPTPPPRFLPEDRRFAEQLRAAIRLTEYGPGHH